MPQWDWGRRFSSTDIASLTCLFLVNQDPMDPKFDLEAYFEALVKQKP